MVISNLLSIEIGINTIFNEKCYPIKGNIIFSKNDISIQGNFTINRNQNAIYIEMNPSEISNFNSDELYNFFTDVNYELNPISTFMYYLSDSICADGLTGIKISGRGQLTGDFSFSMEPNSSTKAYGILIPYTDSFTIYFIK